MRVLCIQSYLNKTTFMVSLNIRIVIFIIFIKCNLADILWLYMKSTRKLHNNYLACVICEG